jgi:hypothetical protein
MQGLSSWPYRQRLVWSLVYPSSFSDKMVVVHLGEKIGPRNRFRIEIVVTVEVIFIITNSAR